MKLCPLPPSFSFPFFFVIPCFLSHFSFSPTLPLSLFLLSFSSSIPISLFPTFVLIPSSFPSLYLPASLYHSHCVSLFLFNSSPYLSYFFLVLSPYLSISLSISHFTVCWASFPKTTDFSLFCTTDDNLCYVLFFLLLHANNFVSFKLPCFIYIFLFFSAFVTCSFHVIGILLFLLLIVDIY